MKRKPVNKIENVKNLLKDRFSIYSKSRVLRRGSKIFFNDPLYKLTIDFWEDSRRLDIKLFCKIDRRTIFSGIHDLEGDGPFKNLDSMVPKNWIEESSLKIFEKHYSPRLKDVIDYYDKIRIPNSLRFILDTSFSTVASH